MPDEPTALPPLELECFALTTGLPKLAPADPRRAWMDAFPERHAYRCLPLAIANAYGWEILSPCALDIEWNGGAQSADIRIRATDGYPYVEHVCASNFTRGIVTFHTGYLFRTSPGWQLMATGPFNKPKHGIAPLTGLIETDWLPYPFTMNWQLTAPGKVHFEKGEPVCLIFPVPQGALNGLTPVVKPVASEPDLERQLGVWRDKRVEFMRGYNALDPAVLKQAWQKFYFRGELPEAGTKAPSHEQKLRLNEPRFENGKKPPFP
ncbi:MAG TPA: DUF6065 family protein [Rhizomicrobium sp.]|jgi:hypothetical protein|nr:DUF6065 family protein [Rhizomicrobium sp.]